MAKRRPTQFKRRWHPLIDPNNSFTWRFLPGIVIGFLVKCWIDNTNPLKVCMNMRNMQDRQYTAQALQQAGANRAPSSGASADKDPINPPTEELKVVLCVNDDLKMGKGKIAAQCGHAIMGLMQRVQKRAPQLLPQYEYFGQAKIALRVPNATDMVWLQTHTCVLHSVCMLSTYTTNHHSGSWRRQHNNRAFLPTSCMMQAAHRFLRVRRRCLQLDLHRKVHWMRSLGTSNCSEYLIAVLCAVVVQAMMPC